MARDSGDVESTLDLQRLDVFVTPSDNLKGSLSFRSWFRSLRPFSSLSGYAVGILVILEFKVDDLAWCILHIKGTCGFLRSGGLCFGIWSKTEPTAKEASGR